MANCNGTNPGKLVIGQVVEVLSTDWGKAGQVASTGTVNGWYDHSDYHGYDLGRGYWVADATGFTMGHSVAIVRAKQ